MDQKFWDGTIEFFDMLRKRGPLPSVHYNMSSFTRSNVNLRNIPITQLDIGNEGEYDVFDIGINSSILPTTLTGMDVALCSQGRLSPNFDLRDMTSLEVLGFGELVAPLDCSLFPPSLAFLTLYSPYKLPVFNLPPSLTDLTIFALNYPHPINHPTLRMLYINLSSTALPASPNLVELFLESFNIHHLGTITSDTFPVLDKLVIGSIDGEPTSELDLSTLPAYLRRLEIAPNGQITSFPSGIEHLLIRLDKFSLKMTSSMWPSPSHINTLTLHGGLNTYTLKPGDIPGESITSLNLIFYDQPIANLAMITPSLRYYRWHDDRSIKYIDQGQQFMDHIPLTTSHIVIHIKSVAFDLRRISPTLFLHIDPDLIRSGFIHLDKIQHILEQQ
ncbi:hypothetical protein SAMD00019534_116040 [Acytostelium subglobosum LB1]|uniref:hypothetical protein n=1 Tax=Acytostelium subglobosum LB1 TaxID=1410327 RepID=UPI00064480C0|nr:hypothetical protein SAMD00019534_116040 [Acytostelium subglobosum LB1]GAM28428.1 hypothetical protein SAMD00019534_116040 [Acytostelium subglobosum LB1]|eukprot:XP_012748745.1 hypothetical protein SAMD00019534_116040 [Acytostelium subglobosum LB1]